MSDAPQFVGVPDPVLIEVPASWPDAVGTTGELVSASSSAKQAIMNVTFCIDPQCGVQLIDSTSLSVIT